MITSEQHELVSFLEKNDLTELDMYCYSLHLSKRDPFNLTLGDARIVLPVKVKVSMIGHYIEIHPDGKKGNVLKKEIRFQHDFFSRIVISDSYEELYDQYVKDLQKAKEQVKEKKRELLEKMDLFDQKLEELEEAGELFLNKGE